MTFSFSYNESDEYLLVTHDGIIDKQYVNAIVKEIAAAVFEHRCHKILSDYRHATLHLNTFEILAAQQKVFDALVENDLSPYLVKRAMVLNKENENNPGLSFFETVSINRSQKVKSFFDLEQAITWLTKE